MGEQMKLPNADFRPSVSRTGFSLVEVLVVLAVTGILLYFAFPNIVQIKSDSERELAKARTETLNLAAVAYVQANGTNILTDGDWANISQEARYGLIERYIAFAATNLSSFLPSSDYRIEFNDTQPHKIKAELFYGPGDTGKISY